MKKIKMLVIFLLIKMCVLSHLDSQKIIKLSATKYNIDLMSLFPYSIEVTIKGGGKEKSKIMSHFDTRSISGYYSSRSLKKMTIICDYTNQTYLRDKEIIEKEYELNFQNTKSAYIRTEIGWQNSLLLKLGIEAATHLKSDYESGLANFISTTSRGVAKFAKGTIMFSEAIAEMNSGKYRTLNDLVEEYIKGKIRDEAYEFIKNAINEKLGLEIPISDFVVNAVATYMEGSTRSENNFYKKIEKLKNERDSKLETIIAYRDDVDFKEKHTYVGYEVAIKPLKLITRSPSFYLSLEPYTFGQGINKDWSSAPDKLVESKNNSDDYVFTASGLIDNSYRVGLQMAVLPEINRKKSFTSRLYIGFSYSNTSFHLKDRFRVSTDIFSETPPNSDGFSISEPLTYELTSLEGSLTWKWIVGNVIFLDFGGGLIYNKGILNLNASKLSEGYAWKEKDVLISDYKMTPFFSSKIGIGTNEYHGGGHFTFGVLIFRPEVEDISKYELTNFENDESITYSNENYILRMHVGINIAF